MCIDDKIRYKTVIKCISIFDCETVHVVICQCPWQGKTAAFFSFQSYKVSIYFFQQ